MFILNHRGVKGSISAHTLAMSRQALPKSVYYFKFICLLYSAETLRNQYRQALSAWEPTRQLSCSGWLTTPNGFWPLSCLTRPKRLSSVAQPKPHHTWKSSWHSTGKLFHSLRRIGSCTRRWIRPLNSYGMVHLGNRFL